MVPLKHFNSQSRISLEILEQRSLNLAPEMYITKETKRHPSCCCYDSGYAAGPVSIKTRTPRIYLKQGSSTPKNLMGRVKTTWEPCVFRARPSVPFQRIANGHIWFFTERDWSQECCHAQHSRCNNILCVSFVICISGAKFEEHCSNISGDIFDSVFYCSSETICDVITFLICVIQKRKYL